MAEARDTGGVRMVRADRLRPFVRSLFTAVGVPDADAETVAEVLVEADLRGVESHGTTRVAGYVSMIKGGLLNPKPTVEVLRDTPSTAMLEGDRAFGIVVATRAMRLAIDKAARAGVACVTARNVTHTGMVGFYPMLAARADAIFDIRRHQDGFRQVRAESRYPTEDRFLLRRLRKGQGELIVAAEDPKAAAKASLHEKIAEGLSVRQAAAAVGIPFSTAQRWANGE